MTFLRFFYNFIPFKRFFFAGIKSVYVPSESVYKHLYFNGKFKVNVGNKRYFWMYHHGYQLENEIFWQGITGKYEAKSLEIWLKLAENSSCIFDVGSNTGIYALSASAINKTASIVAFEPVESIFDLLSLNVGINESTITCVKKALSSESGTVSVYNTPNKHDYIVSLERDRLKDTPNSELVTLEKTSFASFVDEHGIKQVDLIKIDVEYHEFEVLKGMKDKLYSMRPDMLIEIVEEDLASKINSLLENLNYLFFDINDSNRTINRIDKVQKSSTYNILVCKESTARKVGLL